MSASGLLRGTDGVTRCSWAGSAPEYLEYHDTEWGVPVHGERKLFERITLEAFQSGLAWITILRKRPAFRAAFANFDPQTVARFDDEDVDRLMADSSIVRNRRKIAAAVNNAQAVVALREVGGLDTFFWSFRPAQHHRPSSTAEFATTSPESVALSKALKAKGFAHVGPTTMYAAMQACGVIDDHVRGCFRSEATQ